MVWHHISLYGNRGNEGILFSTIINTIDVAVLHESVLCHSTIDFNPTVLFV